MPNCNTPPSSPHNLELMDEDIISPDDVDELIELYEAVLEQVDAENRVDSDDDDDDDDEEEEGEEEEEAEGGDDSEERLPPLPDISKKIFNRHHGAVFCCDIEPKEGQLVATGGIDDRALVWNALSGNILFPCTQHQDSVTHVEFNHDGTYLASGDIGGIVQVWKVATQACVWNTQVGDINWLKWHHGANVLVVGTAEGDAFIWRIPSGESKVLAGHGSKLECGVIMPDGKRCVIAYRDSTLKVFDMKSSSVLHHIKPSADSLDGYTCIDAHTDNNLVIAGAYSGMAVLVTTQSGRVVGSFDCRPASGDDSEISVESVEFCKNGDLHIAATGTLDGTVTIWDTAHQTVRHTIKGSYGVVKLKWHKKKPWVFVADTNGTIKVYDALSGTQIYVFSGHKECILDFTMNNSILVSGSDDMTARVFSIIPLAVDDV